METAPLSTPRPTVAIEDCTLPEAALAMIEERIPRGSTIFELGSGASSIRLNHSYNLVSIEEDPGWVRDHPGRCILAPVRRLPLSVLHGERGWYDPDIVTASAPERVDLLLVDGPSVGVGRTGILQCPEILRCAGAVLVGDTHRPAEHSLALAIAALTRGTLLMFRPSRRSQGGGWRSWAWIEAVAPPVPPAPLPSPNAVSLLPNGMIIAPPRGVANDHAWIGQQVQEGRFSWYPHLPISVVIPLYNRREMLGRTLAALTHQTYPRDLIEVVVADDGSDDDPSSLIGTFQDQLNVRHVTQPHLGYRLAAVRNLGIRSASHDHIIVLDCDVAPVPRCLETYARYMEVTPRAVLCGHRRFVDANAISVEEVRRSIEPLLALEDIETSNEHVKGRKGVPTVDWRVLLYQQSDDLRFEPYPFRAVVGATFGFHRSVLDRAGWFDEAFTAWAAEDTEWGFRVWNTGHWIVPLIEACGLHQEPPGRAEADRKSEKPTTLSLLIDRCPVRYRKPEHGTRHSVPLVSIYIPAHDAEETIVDAVRSALQQTVKDLEVCIVDDGSTDGTRARLEQEFGRDPRVRVAHQAHQGIGAASNAAVRMCKGVFIGQLDSDDLLKPNAVETLLARIQEDTRLGVVYGSCQKVDEHGRIFTDCYEWPEFSREKLMCTMIVHHFRLFRARDWWRTAGFAEDIENAVDYDLFLKLSEVTEFEHIRRPVYLYRVHRRGTSVANKQAQDRNCKTVLEWALRRRGLDRAWRIEIPDPEYPRKVEYVPIDAPHVDVSAEGAEGRVGPGSPVYRLRIGPFAALEDAREAMRRVRRFRRKWIFHHEATAKGMKPPIAIVSGRIAEDRIEQHASAFAAEFPYWPLAIVRESNPGRLSVHRSMGVGLIEDAQAAALSRHRSRLLVRLKSTVGPLVVWARGRLALAGRSDQDSA